MRSRTLASTASSTRPRWPGPLHPAGAGVSEQVDINIIVATGPHTFDEIPHFCHCRGPGAILDGPELMTEMFVNDIRHGIGGTEVRAAFFKGVVEDRGLTADQARVQAAICEAHQETGCDRFGLDMFNPTADRVRTITALRAQGCADRIVLSHDASCYMGFFSVRRPTRCCVRQYRTGTSCASRKTCYQRCASRASRKDNSPQCSSTTPAATSQVPHHDRRRRDLPHTQPVHA